jgi:DNA-binding transcriptional regulator GbsR (MarR family)
MPRMPARVFVALLTSESGRLTANELADSLQVSPAAISGAVRYLHQLNMVSREREPGSRRDHYVLHDDTWSKLIARREQVLERWQASAAEGIALLGAETAAGARLAESLEFFDFLRAEMSPLLRRWRERKTLESSRG